MLIEDLWREAAKVTGYHGLQEVGIRIRKESLAETISIYKHCKLTNLLSFQINFFAEEESRIVTKWVNDRHRSPVENISSLLETCVPHELHELLKEPIDPQPARKLELADLLLLP
jgi:hypothetical protein